MIKSFRCKHSLALWEGQLPPRFRAIERAALRKLDMLAASSDLADLTSPPGNRLGALKGSRKGQHSIRINDQWRVCFGWDDGASEVEIVDYHS